MAPYKSATQARREEAKRSLPAGATPAQISAASRALIPTAPQGGAAAIGNAMAAGGPLVTPQGMFAPQDTTPRNTPTGTKYGQIVPGGGRNPLTNTGMEEFVPPDILNAAIKYAQENSSQFETLKPIYDFATGKIGYQSSVSGQIVGGGNADYLNNQLSKTVSANQPTTTQGGGVGGEYPVQEQAVSAPAGSSVGTPINPQTGEPVQLQFNTGNPQEDKYLNEFLLPLMEGQVANDPLALYDPARFQKILDYVNADPIWNVAKNRVEEDFKLKQSGIDLTRREQTTGIEKKLGELGTQKTQLSEDAGRERVREARNLQQATQETADAYASRGRAFGGGRIAAESSLAEKSAQNVSDINLGESRGLSQATEQERQLGLQQGFIGEQYGPQGLEQRGLGIERGRSLQEIEAQKLQTAANERARLSGLGADLLKTREFIPTRSLT